MERILQNNFIRQRPRLRAVSEILIQTLEEWKKDNTLRLGAGIAYYGIIAIVPLILVAVGIAEIFFASSEIQLFIESFVESLFGEQAASILPEIEETVEGEAVDTSFYSSSLYSFGVLLFTASLIFLALQDALNVIWKNQRGFKFSIKRYISSFLIMLVVGMTMTAILTTHAILNFASSLLPDDVQIISFFTGFVSFAVVFSIVVGTILLLLRSFIVSDISLRDLVLSSVIISALMYAGVYGLAVYFSSFADKSIYGAIAGLVLVLVAIYYFAQIFLAGAQLSKVIAYRRGNKHLQKHLKSTDPR